MGAAKFLVKGVIVVVVIVVILAIIGLIVKRKLGHRSQPEEPAPAPWSLGYQPQQVQLPPPVYYAQMAHDIEQGRLSKTNGSVIENEVK